MDRAKKLAKIRDEENESKFGFVHGVSGPGKKTGLKLKGPSPFRIDDAGPTCGRFVNL